MGGRGGAVLRIKAIPTKSDGIQFRSRLEASWHWFFKLSGFTSLYEPCVIDIGNIVKGYEPQDEWFGFDLWVPDFQLFCKNWCYGYAFENQPFVEIKPLKESLDEHDRKSIGSAIIYGYEEPTIVIMGSPLMYYAVLINERHKGNPAGVEISFGRNGFCAVGEWFLDGSYPDECGVSNVLHPLEGSLRNSRDAIIRNHNCQIAKEAWNRTQWKGR
jgi:hypothetical protein